MDFMADSLCGAYPCGVDSTEFCFEPCIALIDSVRLDPGGELDIPAFEIEAPGEEN